MSVETPVPAGRPGLSGLREAAASCRACPLWRTGTQTVFGEGRTRSEVVLVGEQPGDQEDKAGKPFVGPAGKLLDRALAESGIDRSVTYVTNVVKHFKREARGKKRIHKKPNLSEIAACRPWLDAELESLRPKRARLPRVDRSASAAGPRIPRHPGTGPGGGFRSRPARDRDDPSVGNPPDAGEGRARRGDAGVRERSRSRGHVHSRIDLNPSAEWRFSNRWNTQTTAYRLEKRFAGVVPSTV